MHLATRWFGSRTEDLPAQMAAAAELGFRGVALLPDSQRASTGTEFRPPPGCDVAAIAWDGLAGPERPSELPAQCWSLADLSTVLQTLRRLDCRLLIVPAGEDRDEARRARGRRLLSRLQEEGRLDPDDEALATLRAADRFPVERQLEELAALVHAAARAAPGLRVALAPHPSPAGLLDPAGFALLVTALGDDAPSLWHDVGVAEARAAAGLEPPGAWLDRWGGRVAGAGLHDWAAGHGHLPPGAGAVDWPLLREYLPRGCVRVLDLAPSYPGAVLTEARTALAAQQLA